MSEKMPSQEDRRMQEAQRILDEKGIIAGVRVRVEQARPGQEEGWEYMGLIMQDGNPIAEVKKGNEVRQIAAGRLAAWQTKSPEQLRKPAENRNIYRDEGSARQHNATVEELRQGNRKNER